MHPRREFLVDIGRGMLIASVGSTLAMELGLSQVRADESKPLSFGMLEPLVALMQETQTSKIQEVLVAKINEGTSHQSLVVAGALANARTFGGQDYDGYHTFMALLPALEMSKELLSSERALPILKVLYRNNQRIQNHGGRTNEVLRELHHHDHSEHPTAVELQAATRKGDMDKAEQVFASISSGPVNEAFNHLQFAIQDEVDVHRTVLAWRAWSMLDLAGTQHAHTLLRQSVRFCVDAEVSRKSRGASVCGIRELLPSLLSDLGLLNKPVGDRVSSDHELMQLTESIFSGSREQAARAMAQALAGGMSPISAGEALSMAANQLLLFDPGRAPQHAEPGKPAGSVHGASVGVHACDSANAWRNIAKVSEHRNCIASLIVGAYHTAGQVANVGKVEFPYVASVEGMQDASPEELLKVANEAIQSKDQLRASAAIYRYGQLEAPSRPVFDLLLGYAVSEEGALHAEKFYRTVQEEFALARPSMRWKHLVGLARVTASEFGQPAAGQDEARKLLRL